MTSADAATVGTTPETRLETLGVELPPPLEPVANYVALTRAGDIVYTSGHGPVADGRVAYSGKVGRDLNVEEAKAAARLTMLNILGSLKAELGSLTAIGRILKLTVMVSSAPEFSDQHLVANGASDLLVELFGAERGAHSRSAVGMASLPLGMAVEIEAIVLARRDDDA